MFVISILADFSLLPHREEVVQHVNTCYSFYKRGIWVLSIKYRIQSRLNRWNNLFVLL